MCLRGQRNGQLSLMLQHVAMLLVKLIQFLPAPWGADVQEKFVAQTIVGIRRDAGHVLTQVKLVALIKHNALALRRISGNARLLMG